MESLDSNCAIQFPIDRSFAGHFQKLYADYEKLQLEYGKLRKKFTKHQIKSKCDHSFVLADSAANDKTIEELKRDLEKEKLHSKSLNAEISVLIKDIKTIENRYTDLLAIFTAQKEQNNENGRLKELENENKELKETLDFVTSENMVLKDLEERTFKEKLEWLEEKRKYEQVVVWSKHINDKLKATLAKNDDYLKQSYSINRFLNFLFDFCSIQYQSLLSNDVIENFKKCTNEKLEEKIAIIEEIIKSFQKSQNNNSDNSIELSKLKITDLCKENNILKENNKCLSTELEELKNILNKDDIKSDEINLKLENAKLTEKLRHKEEMLEKLSEKFSRNRSVLEENYKRSTEEIKALDNFIAIIIEKLNNLPADLKNCSDLKGLIEIINENDLETSENK